MIEPEEGKFDFSFLDEVLDKLYRNRMKVFFATPSGASPAWLSLKYPEILRTNEYGIKQHHGGRHNHCFTSPVYREKVKTINNQRRWNAPGKKLEEDLINPEIKKQYKCEVATDNYGRKIPKHAYGTANICRMTSSAMLIMKAAMGLRESVFREIDKSEFVVKPHCNKNQNFGRI